ncbi:flagellin lysine-N-methylase [Vibrio harveyi]|nr:flagellin lysine-N-methylase [Vibrio harveyi]
MQKTTVTPKYVLDFACIGSACEDHCCHGWNINIDRDTYHFMTRKSVMKIKASEMILRTRGESSYARIKLNTEGECPFRQADGLCEVHAKHGHERLSQTCKTYPRLRSVRGDQIQHSLTLSCPEAARKILLDPCAMQFDIQSEFDPKFKPLKYTPPQGHEVIRELFLTLLSNNEQTFEQNVFTFGIALKQLAKADDSAWLSTFEQVLNQVNSGHIQTYYADLKPVTELHTTYLLKGYNAFFALGVLGEKTHVLNRLNLLNEQLKSALTEAEDDIAQQQAVLVKGYNEHYQTYFATRPYIWVNYFIYQMYQQDFPSANMIDQFKEMVTDFFFLRGALLLIASVRPLSDADVIFVVQTYHRARSHGGQFGKVLEGLSQQLAVDKDTLPLLMLKVC